MPLVDVLLESKGTEYYPDRSLDVNNTCFLCTNKLVVHIQSRHLNPLLLSVFILLIPFIGILLATPTLTTIKVQGIDGIRSRWMRWKGTCQLGHYNINIHQWNELWNISCFEHFDTFYAQPFVSTQNTHQIIVNASYAIIICFVPYIHDYHL